MSRTASFPDNASELAGPSNTLSFLAQMAATP